MPVDVHVFEYSTAVTWDVRDVVVWTMVVGSAPTGGHLFESVGDHVLGINYMSFMGGRVWVHSGANMESPTCKTIH